MARDPWEKKKKRTLGTRVGVRSKKCLKNPRFWLPCTKVDREGTEQRPDRKSEIEDASWKKNQCGRVALDRQLKI